MVHFIIFFLKIQCQFCSLFTVCSFHLLFTDILEKEIGWLDDKVTKLTEFLVDWLLPTKNRTFCSFTTNHLFKRPGHTASFIELFFVEEKKYSIELKKEIWNLKQNRFMVFQNSLNFACIINAMFYKIQINF